MAWDNVWDSVFKTKKWGQYPHVELVRFIAKNFYTVEDRSKIRILEVGCGPGANLWFLAREGFSVYGIDGSPTAVQQATERLNKEVPSWIGKIDRGDITHLPYEDEQFDAVLDYEAVTCNKWNDSATIYSEMARVLKKNGVFFSATFASGTWGENKGKKVGHNAYIVSEGPLSGVGVNRFTDKFEINDLVDQSISLNPVEYVLRTIEGGSRYIKEWIITGIKSE